MTTNPPPLPNLPPPVNTLDDALKFAEALADREINAIDRLHQRTLKYISIGAAAFGLMFSVFTFTFTFIGYRDLKTAAIRVAVDAVHEEVVQQVRTQLTTERLKDVVHDETNEFVRTDLRSQLHNEITTGPLHQEILSIASTQSKQLISSQLAPRHFTDAQAVRLRAAIAQNPDLIGYPVIALPQGFDLEAERYCKEIAGALLASKMKKFGLGNLEQPAEPLEGVVIYFYGFDRKQAESLAQAFRFAGVNTTVQDSRKALVLPPGERTPLFVFVGPKPLSINQPK